MKKIRIILISVLLLSISGANAQIGIQTESPITLLHIDATRDNSPTPTSNQLLNDVFIDNNGNIGLGVSAPMARLEIADLSPTVIPPLRIVDESTMANKVLESVTTEGAARWTQQPPSYTKIYTATTDQLFTHNIESDLILDGAITIPITGKYLITVRWFGRFIITSGYGRTISAYVYLYKGSGASKTSLDQIEYYTTAPLNGFVTFTTSLYAGDRTAGDVLSLAVRPLIGSTSGISAWQIGPSLSGGRAGYVPTVILYSI